MRVSDAKRSRVRWREERDEENIEFGSRNGRRSDRELRRDGMVMMMNEIDTTIGC